MGAVGRAKKWSGCISNHGSEDILVTHLRGRTNSFFRNEGNGVFHDAAAQFGLIAPSLPFSGVIGSNRE